MNIKTAIKLINEKQCFFGILWKVIVEKPEEF